MNPIGNSSPRGGGGLGVRAEDDILCDSGRGGGLGVRDAKEDSDIVSGSMGGGGLGIRRSGSRSFQLPSGQLVLTVRRRMKMGYSAACGISSL